MVGNSGIIVLNEPVDFVYRVQVRAIQYFERHGKNKRRMCTLCLKRLIANQPWIQTQIETFWKPLCMECAHEQGVLYRLRQQGVIW